LHKSKKLDFSQFDLNKQLLEAVTDAGYTEPTPIQIKAIPAITGGQDILGIAQTGTGKTAAYLLPLLMKVKFAQGVHPRALILVPTRELGVQVLENAQMLGKYTDLRFASLYGGLGPKLQIEQLKKGVDIIVATPGRLMELYLKGDLVLKDVKTLILDEADRMLDMGFMPQIRKILEVVPRKRQNLLFSATFPEKVEKFSAEFLEWPTRIEVSPQSTPVETVSQLIYPVPNLHTKLNLLLHFLEDTQFSRVIVFVRTRQLAENIYRYLGRKTIGIVRTIHANKGQNSRLNAFEEFKSGNVRVLVCTDVSSRGIDIQDVSHVVNFDVPLVYEDYVHRIGRTGRASKLGMSITFMSPAEEHHVRKIEELIRMKIPFAHIPSGVEIAETPSEERKEMLRTIDMLRRKADPTFKGAFHEKKWVMKAREAGKKIPTRRNESFKKQADQKPKNSNIKKRVVGKKNPKK
jgi:ATP-dependent RNA helicase RhlE